MCQKVIGYKKQRFLHAYVKWDWTKKKQMKQIKIGRIKNAFDKNQCVLLFVCVLPKPNGMESKCPQAMYVYII